MTNAILPKTVPADKGSTPTGPVTMPLTLAHYETLIDAGVFDPSPGKIELIHGRLTYMNPQGPEHAAPIDILDEWSHEVVQRRFRIRVEKPLTIPEHQSCPEPDLVWVTRQSYFDRHPNASEVHLLIEVSDSSAAFDRSEKRDLYAEAMVKEYWLVDVAHRQIEVFREPVSGKFQKQHLHKTSETISPLCLPEAKLAVNTLFSAAPPLSPPGVPQGQSTS